MKKFIIITLITLIFTFMPVLAKSSEKDYTVKFNGSKFHLLYSIKNKEFGGYLNEYYKNGETYNIWTELLAVHHFPNAYSPIDRIRDFKDYLGSMHVPSSLTFDDKKNTAMIDFIMISEKQMPIVLEFNVFKYEKSKKCGSVAIQYAKRYSATTTMQIEEIKQDFEKNRKHIIKNLKKFKIPELITYNIDKCISATDIIEENKNSKTEENENVEEIKETSIITEAANNDKIELQEENPTEETTLEQTDKTITAAEQNDTKEEIVSTENEQINENNIECKNTDVNTNNIESVDTIKIEESEIKPEIEENKQNEEIIPTTINSLDNNIDKSRKTQKIKEINYIYSNNKDQYIAEPRSKKELKNEVKQNKKKQKEALKAAKTKYQIINNNSDLIAKPRTKQELKKQNKVMKKKAKERAKKARKALNE